MTKPSVKGLNNYLLDLSEWGGKTARAVERTSRDTIGQDEQAELALARAVEIVGENAGRSLAQEPDWVQGDFSRDLSNAYRLRNRLPHGYDNISPDVLFDIARDNIPVPVNRARLQLAQLSHDRS